jgi:hypothetical protein
MLDNKPAHIGNGYTAEQVAAGYKVVDELTGKSHVAESIEEALSLFNEEE